MSSGYRVSGGGSFPQHLTATDHLAQLSWIPEQVKICSDRTCYDLFPVIQADSIIDSGSELRLSP
jgi:hypothetical protein